MPNLADLARSIPQVVECHIMKLLTGLDQLDAVLDQFLEHGQTTTSIVQSSPVPPRDLPFGDAGNR